MDSGYLDLGVENYRAYRYNWTGLPNEEPAIAVLNSTGCISIHVSWNGDTETKLWRIYAHEEGQQQRSTLGEIERTSFETVLRVVGKAVTKASAEAVDAYGNVLSTTSIAIIEPDYYPGNVCSGGDSGLMDLATEQNPFI